MNIHRFYDLFALSIRANHGWGARAKRADCPEELTGLTTPRSRDRLELSHADKYTLMTLVHAAESIPCGSGSVIDKKQQQHSEGVITDYEFVVSVAEKIIEELEGASARLTSNQS